MTIGVIGGGAWGTALAHLLAEREPVLLWAREPEVVAAINAIHENTLFLPGVILPPDIIATNDLTAMSACEELLVVAPAQYLRAMLTILQPQVLIILCAKGIEVDTQLLMSEVAGAVAPGCPLAVLSGPTFAREVAERLPTAITLGCNNAALGKQLITRLARPYFRPYLTNDIVGTEIGGAVKNVLAIACGVAAGAKLGQNAQAALIARGFAEMVRFGLAKGARADTLSGLSGLGDLVLTCSSTQSRNFSLGVALGEGHAATEVLKKRNSVAEGAYTAPALKKAADALGVETPVVDAVCALIDGSASVSDVMNNLLARPLRDE